ncbi:MAG TPA: hypothetical protein VNL69_01280 [Bacteroidota bacterium]|nr:hypothetical protein [Bacteroidota bacterium]
MKIKKNLSVWCAGVAAAGLISTSAAEPSGAVDPKSRLSVQIKSLESRMREAVPNNGCLLAVFRIPVKGLEGHFIRLLVGLDLASGAWLKVQGWDGMGFGQQPDGTPMSGSLTAGDFQATPDVDWVTAEQIEKFFPHVFLRDLVQRSHLLITLGSTVDGVLEGAASLPTQWRHEQVDRSSREVDIVTFAVDSSFRLSRLRRYGHDPIAPVYSQVVGVPDALQVPLRPYGEWELESLEFHEDAAMVDLFTPEGVRALARAYSIIQN